MKHQPSLTQSRLRELVTYFPETGEFVRNVRVANQHAGTTPGSVNKLGYRLIFIDNKRYRAHHLVWLYVHGYLPAYLDHIDRDPSNNKLANLREATHAQNMQNRSFSKANKSGFTGVRPHQKLKNRWLAQIRANNKCIYLGTFSTPEEASAAYSTAKVKYHTYAQGV